MQKAAQAQGLVVLVRDRGSSSPLRGRRPVWPLGQEENNRLEQPGIIKAWGTNGLQEWASNPRNSGLAAP